MSQQFWAKRLNSSQKETTSNSEWGSQAWKTVHKNYTVNPCICKRIS
jgi:hypothetical protein